MARAVASGCGEIARCNRSGYVNTFDGSADKAGGTERMSAAKRKGLVPREPADERPPRSPRGRTRLASEPASARRPFTDRWEPGFLRLPSLGGAESLSYVVDSIGIYYDATTPSELEILLQSGGWETDGLLRRAGPAMEALRASGLSLCNDPRRADLGEILAAARGEAPAKPVVVVVDQPFDDLAIGFGLAGPGRFTSMLAYADVENPDCDIVVVMDPSSPDAAERGYLLSQRSLRGVRYVAEPVSAPSILAAAKRIYTVSSHLGFEALMAGLPVTCFGVPFYAGWGPTDDRLSTPRRSRRRSLEEVFAASHLVYSRYFDPFGGGPISFEEALDLLRLNVSRERENAATTLCVGFAAWKRRWVQAALGAQGFRPILTNRDRILPKDLTGAGRVVTWASRAPRAIEASCRRAKVTCWRMEDGFIRSVGLGVGLRIGASYVLDRTGIYYDATRPSDLETILQTATFDDVLLERAAKLREAIVTGGVSKYNVGDPSLPALPEHHGKVVLVAGQVENDASLQLGASTVEGNAGLLRRARERSPEAFVVYKPHPDVEAGLRPGLVGPEALAGLCDHVLRDVAAPSAIAIADEVEVATSLIGFEALLRGKRVVTHGVPFYAGWGLTEDPGCERRTRRLTLDELVAGALILYPRYVDPVTGLACPPEVIVERLAAGDPAVTRRVLSFEAVLKQAWSMAFRRRNG
jgi:capsular polysaccharide export protein